jgi:hypothetical protein
LGFVGYIGIIVEKTLPLKQKNGFVKTIQPRNIVPLENT